MENEGPYREGPKPEQKEFFFFCNLASLSLFLKELNEWLREHKGKIDISSFESVGNQYIFVLYHERE